MNQASKLEATLNLVKELDKLKQVIRRNYLLDGSRSENTAEHSWHAALSALLLQEFANEAIDINKVVRMLLIHDVVEIEAGDTYLYDTAAEVGQAERELAAAHNIFSMLPGEEGDQYLQLWLEFEERETPEAKFAKAIDRFMPMLANYESGGKSWLENKVSRARILEINKIVADGSEALWHLIINMSTDAYNKGWLV